MKDVVLNPTPRSIVPSYASMFTGMVVVYESVVLRTKTLQFI